METMRFFASELTSLKRRKEQNKTKLRVIYGSELSNSETQTGSGTSQSFAD